MRKGSAAVTMMGTIVGFIAVGVVLGQVVLRASADSTNYAVSSDDEKMLHSFVENVNTRCDFSYSQEATTGNVDPAEVEVNFENGKNLSVDNIVQSGSFEKSTVSLGRENSESLQFEVDSCRLETSSDSAISLDNGEASLKIECTDSCGCQQTEGVSCPPTLTISKN